MSRGSPRVGHLSHPGIMAHLAAARGDVGRAEALYRENFTLSWAIGDRRFVASALAGFAWTVAGTRPS